MISLKEYFSIFYNASLNLESLVVNSRNSLIEIKYIFVLIFFSSSTLNQKVF